MRLRVVDIETTGLAPPSEIIEVGRVDVVWDGDGWRCQHPLTQLYRPLNGIPPEAMAVHHITEIDFTADNPSCTEDELRAAIWTTEVPDVLVAHNSSFEEAFIPASITTTLPWICTFKTALRTWPDAPGHSNQTLRYWRGLRLDATQAMPPHRAGPDAWVTAHLLIEMLKEVSVDQMIAWSSQPKLFPRIPFGKYRNAAWSDVPSDYFHWMLKQADMDPDHLWRARHELDQRAG